MVIFEKVLRAFQVVPAWVPLCVLPALCLVALALFGFLGKRKAYPTVCLALAGLGTAFICVQESALSYRFSSAVYAVAYFGLFVAWSALWGCLLFLPPLKKRAKTKSTKADKMYEKFHQELSVPPIRDVKPPKVCCFEQTPAEEMQECAPQLAHADALIAKLSAGKLAAGDRLELDALKRKIDVYRGKPLTKEEARSLNDCLSSVLKLTAKYKL